MDVGERIKHYRDRRAMTQQVLADRIYTSRANISMWEQNVRVPAVVHVVNICKVFYISPNELLGWKS